MQNQIGKNIKVLSLNNLGEYTSKEYEGFCKKVGIKKEVTVLYNPPKVGMGLQSEIINSS